MCSSIDFVILRHLGNDIHLPRLLITAEQNGFPTGMPTADRLPIMRSGPYMNIDDSNYRTIVISLVLVILLGMRILDVEISSSCAFPWRAGSHRG